MTKAKVWMIYKLASKLTWIGIIEAKPEKETVEISAKEFKVSSTGSLPRRQRGTSRHRGS
jgi:hypothetical protein